MYRSSHFGFHGVFFDEVPNIFSKEYAEYDYYKMLYGVVKAETWAKQHDSVPLSPPKHFGLKQTLTDPARPPAHPPRTHSPAQKRGSRADAHKRARAKHTRSQTSTQTLMSTHTQTRAHMRALCCAHKLTRTHGSHTRTNMHKRIHTHTRARARHTHHTHIHQAPTHTPCLRAR